MKIRNVTGQKFGKLTVLEDNETRKDTKGRSRRYLKCKCDCGNICFVEKAKLTRGLTRSCGCMQKEMREHFKEITKLEYGKASFNSTYTRYKNGAKSRNLTFELTEEEFKSIITKPCIYCGSVCESKGVHSKRVNGTFNYTGIDRVDSSKGYQVNNCVPCCKICNRMKSDMGKDEFLKHIEKMHNHSTVGNAQLKERKIKCYI